MKKFLGILAIAGVLTACAPAPQAAQQGAAAVPKAGAVDSVVPQAASGGLSGEVVFGIMGGPEADAHTRLAPQFVKMSGGKLTLRVDEVGRVHVADGIDHPCVVNVTIAQPDVVGNRAAEEKHVL